MSNFLNTYLGTVRAGRIYVLNATYIISGKRSRQLKERSKKIRNKDKKYILMNDINCYHYNQHVNQFIFTIVLNICITITLALLIKSSITGTIDKRVNKQVQCVLEDRIMNQTMYANEIMNLQIEKHIINTKFKLLMDKYLQEYDDVLEDKSKAIEEGNSSNTDEADEYKIYNLVLRKELFEDMEDLEKATKKSMKLLERSKGNGKKKNINL